MRYGQSGCSLLPNSIKNLQLSHGYRLLEDSRQHTNSHATKELRKSKVGFFSVLKATRPKAKSVDIVVMKIPFDRFSLRQDMRKVRLIISSNKGLMHTTFDLLLEAILRDKEMRMVGKLEHRQKYFNDSS